MILVTGAAQGLGAAIAVALARMKRDLVIHHHRSDPTPVVKECEKLGVRVETIQGALSTDLVERYCDRFPNTSGLVNNVGNFREDTPKEASCDLMFANLEIPMLFCQRLLPSIERERGHIVNIGTVGIEKPTVSCTSYALTKAALWKYTLSLAKTTPLVKINMVSPGALENTVGNPTQTLVPLSEVARLVAFLFSSEAITGQNIEVSAGFCL